MSTPKYEAVKVNLIEFIQKSGLKYGDSMPTESELVKKFEVSRHTIRRALSDMVNDGWLYTMQGSGTYVSDPNADSSQMTKMVGVVTTYFKDYIFPDIISGMDDVFTENGYSILLGSTKNNASRERVVINNMLNTQLAGLIIEPTKSVYPNQNIALYKQFKDRGIPVLFIHATYRDLDTSYVIEDDEYAGYIATKHLIENGHEKIIGIFKQDDMQGHGRYQGYRNALEEAGITLEPEYVKWFTTEEKKNVTSLENVNQYLKECPQATGFICYNDQISMNLLHTLKSMDIEIPRDYSLVSFDNSNLANSYVVKLTSVAHPKAVLGEEAAHLLIELMKDPTQKFEKVMKPNLVIGETSRKI